MQTSVWEDRHLAIDILAMVRSSTQSPAKTEDKGVLPSLKVRLREPYGTYDIKILHASLTFLVLQQQQNLGRRFGTSKMHLSPPPRG